MRPLNATPHLLATLLVTAAAVATAFLIPTPARALTITVSAGNGPNRVVGSGKEVVVARKIGAFSTLRVDGPIDVDAHPGANPGVTVHAEDNVEPLIETMVEGDALVVRLRRDSSLSTHRAPRVEVEFATLAASRQTGSGNLRVHGLDAPRFDAAISGSGDFQLDDAQLGSLSVSVSGSGDVRLAGHADGARYHIAGSGDIDAGALAARRVDIGISGSGDAHVNATQALDARVSGSGDITYSGQPHDVSRRVSGSGSIEAVR